MKGTPRHGHILGLNKYVALAIMWRMFLFSTKKYELPTTTLFTVISDGSNTYMYVWKKEREREILLWLSFSSEWHTGK